MILVIADDLSGAAELANLAARRGLSTEVHLAFDPATKADVVCLDTNSRMLSAEEAARRVAVAAAEVAAARPDWVFKKCDSVLRGAVMEEARAMARVFAKEGLVIVPANPSRGRLIAKGEYLIEGRPLAETIFRHDPTHPRTTSDVRQLLGESHRATVPDIGSMEDVRRQAAQLPSDALAVGGADFFGALLEARCPPRETARPLPAPAAPRPLLLVCGSAASWSAREAQARAAKVPVFSASDDIQAIVSALGSAGAVLLGVGSEAGQPRLESLARAVDAIHYEQPVRRLLLEGGATASAILQLARWSRFEVRPSDWDGLGILRPPGGGGPEFWVKPGSYAWPKGAWLGA